MSHLARALIHRLLGLRGMGQGWESVCPAESVLRVGPRRISSPQRSTTKEISLELATPAMHERRETSVVWRPLDSIGPSFL